MGAAQGKTVEIGNHKLTVQSQLKSSAKHASFYLAKDANGQLFVLKRYLIRKGAKDLLARSQWESSLYQKIPNHKNLLQCYGLKRSTDKDGNSQLLTIMDFCSKGSLKKIMFKLGHSFQVPDAMHVLQNVCSALLFLHTRDPPVVHLGVRIDNIFRHSNGNWVLGDFNTSAISPVRCSGTEELRKFDQLMDVPKQYRSPEFINIRNSHLVDKASDIWALGVVFYYILFSKYPFDSDKSAILSGKYEIPLSPAYEKPVIDLLESMLQVDPNSRPAIQDLYRNVDELYNHYRLMLGKNLAANSRHSLIPLDAGFAHYWGHNFQLSQDKSSNSSSNQSTPRNQSLSKIGADVSHWASKALVLKLVPPKAKYVRRLVILAWERHDAPSSEVLPGLFDFLLRQPVYTNGIAAYKSLQLIHKLMQEGPASFTSELMQHRSFLLTIAERWQTQQNEIDPWLSQTLIAYSLLLEQRLLFLRESFVFECNFSMSTYLLEARQSHYSGLRADFWFARCFDVVQKMLELGLQLIACGFLAMGVSGIGPSKQHLLFRESILVPVLDDLFGIFSAVTFLLGIIMDCCSLHRTDVSDTKQLYDTFFSRFHALMHRAVKSSLVSLLQGLPELPKTVPELSMNVSVYPPPSNVPGRASNNIEYCEELRSQFVMLLEASSRVKMHHSRSHNDSRSATAPTAHKGVTQASEFNLHNIFENLTHGGSGASDGVPVNVLTPNMPTTSSSSPTSPVTTMKRSYSWAQQGASNTRLKARNPSHADWDVFANDFDWSCSDTVEWTPNCKSNSSHEIGSPSVNNVKASPFDNKKAPELVKTEHRIAEIVQGSAKPNIEITVTKEEDLNNPFAVIERSFKAQQSPRQGVSNPSSALSAEPRSASLTDSGFSTDASELIDSAFGEGEIPADEVKMCDRIGIGGFAEVYKGEWRGTEVAVKKLLMQKQSANTLLEFRKEVALLRNLRHPNVVMFMGACTVPPNLMMVTELLQMSLFDLLHNTNVKLTWKMRLKMALDTATGVNFLHHSRIIHRDLKSANLLLDKHYGVKVSDFGLSRVKTQHVTMTGQCGTFQWMAPEVVSNEKYTEKADVYSFGIILWELAARKIPFEGMNGVQVSVAVVTQNLRPSISEDTPADIRKLIENCWATDPNTRPSFDEIVQRIRTLQQSAFANS